jgi:hypothetical protein
MPLSWRAADFLIGFSHPGVGEFRTENASSFIGWVIASLGHPSAGTATLNPAI